jgi:hypothetical protein
MILNSGHIYHWFQKRPFVCLVGFAARHHISDHMAPEHEKIGVAYLGCFQLKATPDV